MCVCNILMPPSTCGCVSVCVRICLYVHVYIGYMLAHNVRDCVPAYLCIMNA